MLRFVLSLAMGLALALGVTHAIQSSGSSPLSYFVSPYHHGHYSNPYLAAPTPPELPFDG